MRFRILGPVQMTPRTPSAAKPRAVLATLLVQSGSVVSVHTLIDELWCAEPPRTAATTLQVYVSQLRKALLVGSPDAGQPLETRPPGYLMNVGDGELDLTVFESLRVQGREAYEQRDYAHASSLLGQALGLWTGAALSGVPHGPMLETSAVRLEELRSEVLEQRISADLRLGRHHGLVGELMALAHAHPMRETLHAHLMVALYRSGRQSDALAAYHRARHALVGELGVEPGPELKRLLERVLAADPALAWHERPRTGPDGTPPPAGRRDAGTAAGGGRGTGTPGTGTPGTGTLSTAGSEQEGAAVLQPGPVLWLPPRIANFTGRADQIALGTSVLANAPGPGDVGGDGEAPRVLAVSGRAGAGKTALAVQLAYETAEHFPDGRVLLRLRDAGGGSVDPARALSTLLRRLRLAPGGDDRAHAASDHAPGEPTSADGELEELSDRVRACLRGRRMLLVLDDAVSQAQVRAVLSAAPETAVVVTSREAPAGVEGVRHLPLDVLAPPDAERLLAAAGGPRTARDPAAVTEIAELCGYLPLALRVAAAVLAARPHWTPAALAVRLRDERRRLPALTLGDLDVRSSLLTAHQDATPGQQRAFRLLALAPRPHFAPWSAAALLGTGVADAEHEAEELVRRHLLEARRIPGARGSVRFGYHPLLRSLAVEALAEEAPPGGPGTTAAVARLGHAGLALARHADSLLTPGRDRLAAAARTRGRPSPGDGWELPEDEVRRLAAGPPLQWFHDEAPGLLETVRQTHTAGLWQLTAALASSLGGYYEACALWGEWDATHELALDAARQAGDAHAEAVLLRSLGDLAWQRRQAGRAADRYHLARHFFTRCGDAAGAARCLTGEADVLLGQGGTARAEQHYDQALETGRAEGDARGAMEALRGLAFVELSRGRPDGALSRLGECEAAAELAGDTRWLEYARRTAGQARAAAGRGGRETSGELSLEVRPGVWLIQPAPAAGSAAA
ncbi:DNA-binding transcriptional activator of the SARP family [Streptomyces sp. WMMB 714]|uniref:AfsR/SARP family transcriptional regulator n=1 Tax=Streptomyces sp. WMMB 714 TaxID=1286822 RepID=UPI0005F813D7|nr:AfsR/SARP family transcriptional regulator [Streptomyces sp. WMMB 714]SCK29193.1 DNA-binding transcriptional activator of the SARP family [Streptomyces sp. WMMB 714]